MVFKRIGFSRVEMEPLGAMVGNYEVRETKTNVLIRAKRGNMP
jgi:hypothetical protein